MIIIGRRYVNFVLLVIFGIALYFNIQNAIFLYDKFAKIRRILTV